MPEPEMVDDETICRRYPSSDGLHEGADDLGSRYDRMGRKMVPIDTVGGIEKESAGDFHRVPAFTVR